MKITIKLFATLKEGRFEMEEREFTKCPSVKTVINGLGLRKGEVTIVFVNSRHALPETMLKDGDILSLFPPVGGG